ncbi:MAG: PEP-CTERM sorting domain-containing protein [Armatimonadota bacterium]|nr:PEP-CTERM sorting domain-containing protein [bacterium]
MKKLAIVVCILLLFAGVANAAQHTDSVTTSLTKTDWIKTLQLDKFDPIWGHLTSVTFQISGLVNGTCGLENLADTPTEVSVSYTATLTLLRPGGATLVSSAATCSNNYTLANPYDGVICFGEDPDINPTSYYTYTGLDVNVPLMSQMITSNFADFIGTGKMDFNVDARARSRTEASGNVALKYETNAEATATVIYEYTTTPEPGSLIALCTGLVGIAGLSFRRRK